MRVLEHDLVGLARLATLAPRDRVEGAAVELHHPFGGVEQPHQRADYRAFSKITTR